MGQSIKSFSANVLDADALDGIARDVSQSKPSRQDDAFVSRDSQNVEAVQSSIRTLPLSQQQSSFGMMFYFAFSLFTMRETEVSGGWDLQLSQQKTGRWAVKTPASPSIFKHIAMVIRWAKWRGGRFIASPREGGGEVSHQCDTWSPWEAGGRDFFVISLEEALKEETQSSVWAQREAEVPQFGDNRATPTKFYLKKNWKSTYITCWYLLNCPHL